MNICFLVNLTGFGGLEIQTLLRAKDSRERGHLPIVVTRRNTRSEQFAKSNGLSVEYLAGSTILESFKLSKIFDKYEINICIVPKTNLLPLALLGRKFSKSKPKIIFYQQMQSGINKKDIYHNIIYKNLDGAIVLTSKMKTMLIETTNINPERVFVVPYGVDWEAFQNEKHKREENRKLLGIPNDKFVIGCVGRIEPLKGQDTLLVAFAKAKIPNSLLIFAGSVDNQNYLSKMQKIANDFQISKQTLFFEFTCEVPKLMSTLDTFVMPSLSETFGLVLVEAMATSLPVIATNSGGVPEIVEHSVDGLLFEPKDSEELSKLLIHLHQNNEIAKTLGQNALEKVKIKFDYRKNVNKFFEVCNLINSSK